MKTYFNPRNEVTIPNWPFGRLRTTAQFSVEKTRAGERVVRTTVDPKTGKPCAPKKLAYAKIARIVDGSDGKTYLLMLTSSGFLNVFQSDMRLQEEAIFDRDERFLSLLEMLQFHK